jgi:hypothetical protein
MSEKADFQEMAEGKQDINADGTQGDGKAANIQPEIVKNSDRSSDKDGTPQGTAASPSQREQIRNVAELHT